MTQRLNAVEAAAFGQLMTLVGDWKGTSPTGRELSVSYRMVANDTVLVETWTLAPGKQALTLYHMDDRQLIATHYCPLGNQPRLVLERTPAPGRFEFGFRGATNLQATTEAHQDSFWIELQGPDAMSRSETYCEAGVSETEAVAYARVVAEPFQISRETHKASPAPATRS